MGDASYRTLRLSLRAEIGGFDFDDVIQFSSTFELNNIPSASILVAVGSEVVTGEPATIHYAFQSMKFLAPAKVYLKVTPYSSQNVPDKDLQGGEILIFDGYAVGIGWQRTTQGASCVINLQHWLCDLDYSSALSGSSHPANPGNWTYSATFRQINFTGGQASPAGGMKPGWCPHPGGYRALTEGDLADLWEKVFKAWMTGVAKNGNRDPIDERLKGGDNNGSGAAQNALKRIFSKPVLDLDLGGADGLAIADAVQMTLGRSSWESWANTTLWGKLVGEWAPQFMFSIAPRVNDAYVIPFCGGLKGEPYKTIDVHEYNQCDLNCQMPRVLRCVGMTHPLQQQAGGFNNCAGQIAARIGLAGLWPTSPPNVGTIMVKDAPQWLAENLLAWFHSATTTGHINTKPMGLACCEPAGAGPMQPEAARKPVKQGHDMNNLGNKLCHHWYVLEMLKGRVGELSGRLRFDIMPGSQVKVMLGTSKHLEIDELAEPLFGSVMRVSTLINSEMQRAGTAFAIAHLRNTKENEDDRFACDLPPIYKTKFVGGGLVDNP